MSALMKTNFPAPRNRSNRGSQSKRRRNSGVLLPSAYGLLAGYQIQSLRREGQRLATEQAALELSEARLLSPARMEELARVQQFVDPEPQKVVYLDSKAGALAMNKEK